MNVRSAYTNWSQTYDSDRNLTRDLDAQVTRETLSGQHVDAILELGCGTGKNTPFYASLADHVTALDFSEGMLAQARAKSPPANVTFAVADLTASLPVTDASANLVVCNLVLEHIEDIAFVFSEAYRALNDGGQFFVCELHPFRQYAGKKAVFQSGQDQVEIPAFVHHMSDFLDAANAAGFALANLKEWWHENDDALAPRLVSFRFAKPQPGVL